MFHHCFKRHYAANRRWTHTDWHGKRRLTDTLAELKSMSRPTDADSARTATMTANGEKDLNTLIASMDATLHVDAFVFVTVSPSQAIPDSLHKQMVFQEAEGITIISTKLSAEAHDLPYTFESRMITLNVHSSLDAVGFLAAVSSRLAAEVQTGVNPVSGYFHDHLFVPVGREEQVLAVLQKMAVEARVY